MFKQDIVSNIGNLMTATMLHNLDYADATLNNMKMFYKLFNKYVRSVYDCPNNLNNWLVAKGGYANSSSLKGGMSN